MLFYNRQLHRAEQELHTKNEALHQANQQLEQQTVQLEAAYEQERQLNELKDQFLLNVNHELRTPLTEIHGYLNLLLEYRGQLDEDTQTTFIDHAIRGSEELLHLVNNVLDTIHGEMPDRTPYLEDLCVTDVVADAITIFDPQKRQEYPLTLDIPEMPFTLEPIGSICTKFYSICLPMLLNIPHREPLLR